MHAAPGHRQHMSWADFCPCLSSRLLYISLYLLSFFLLLYICFNWHLIWPHSLFYHARCSNATSRGLNQHLDQIFPCRLCWAFQQHPYKQASDLVFFTVCVHSGALFVAMLLTLYTEARENNQLSPECMGFLAGKDQQNTIMSERTMMSQGFMWLYFTQIDASSLQGSDFMKHFTIHVINLTVESWNET